MMSSMGSMISCTTHAVCFGLFLCCSNLAWASGFHEVVATPAWFVVAFFFLCDVSHALVFGLLRLSCVNISTCIGWDCLLACSCCWVCLPCVQLLCFLQWPVIGALRIFTLGSLRLELCFVCRTRFLCVSYKKNGIFCFARIMCRAACRPHTNSHVVLLTSRALCS